MRRSSTSASVTVTIVVATAPPCTLAPDSPVVIASEHELLRAITKLPDTEVAIGVRQSGVQSPTKDLRTTAGSNPLGRQF